MTVPAGLLAAGAASQAQAAIPLTLIHSTSRIALGFMAGNTAAVLARGVLNSMMLNQLKVATILFCLGIGGGYWAWQAFAGPADEKGRLDQGKVASDSRIIAEAKDNPADCNGLSADRLGAG